VGLPRWLVEVRHDGTHSRLPSLEVLRLAASQLLQWLRGFYWEPQDESVAANEPDRAWVAALLLRHLRLQSGGATATSAAAVAAAVAAAEDAGDPPPPEASTTPEECAAALASVPGSDERVAPCIVDLLLHEAPPLGGEGSKSGGGASSGGTTGAAFLDGAAPLLLPKRKRRRRGGGGSSGGGDAVSAEEHRWARWEGLLAAMQRRWPSFATRLFHALCRRALDAEGAAPEGGGGEDAAWAETQEARVEAVVGWCRFLLSRRWWSVFEPSLALVSKRRSLAKQHQDTPVPCTQPALAARSALAARTRAMSTLALARRWELNCALELTPLVLLGCRWSGADRAWFASSAAMAAKTGGAPALAMGQFRLRAWMRACKEATGIRNRHPAAGRLLAALEEAAPPWQARWLVRTSAPALHFSLFLTAQLPPCVCDDSHRPLPARR